MPFIINPLRSCFHSAVHWSRVSYHKWFLSSPSAMSPRQQWQRQILAIQQEPQLKEELVFVNNGAQSKKINNSATTIHSEHPSQRTALSLYGTMQKNLDFLVNDRFAHNTFKQVNAVVASNNDVDLSPALASFCFTTASAVNYSCQNHQTVDPVLPLYLSFNPSLPQSNLLELDLVTIIGREVMSCAREGDGDRFFIRQRPITIRNVDVGSMYQLEELLHLNKCRLLLVIDHVDQLLRVDDNNLAEKEKKDKKKNLSVFLNSLHLTPTGRISTILAFPRASSASAVMLEKKDTDHRLLDVFSWSKIL